MNHDVDAPGDLGTQGIDFDIESAQKIQALSDGLGESRPGRLCAVSSIEVKDVGSPATTNHFHGMGPISIALYGPTSQGIVLLIKGTVVDGKGKAHIAIVFPAGPGYLEVVQCPGLELCLGMLDPGSCKSPCEENEQESPSGAYPGPVSLQPHHHECLLSGLPQGHPSWENSPANF